MSNNTCTICNKTFATPRGLRSHLSWHNPTYAAACSNNGESISKGVRHKVEQKRIIAENIYLTSPKHCKQCSVMLPYDKRGNLYCSHSCSAAYSNTARAKPKTPRTKRTQSRIDLICQECRNKFTVSPFYSKRKYCSITCSNKNKYRPNSTKKKICIYKGFKMDSGAELAFAMLLDEHNIRWIKNTTISFDFVDSEGKNRKYYPDFHLSDYDYWIEIKGKLYVRPDDNLRLEAVGNIELIMSNNIRLPKCVLSDGADEGFRHPDLPRDRRTLFL